MRGLLFYGTTGKFTWRMLATVLGGQSVVIFFGALVARALAAAGGDVSRSTAYLVVGSGLAFACIVGAGTMRRPWGVTLGWLIQVSTLASAVVVPMMLIVGLIFLALWVVCLVQGARVDQIQARRAAEAEEVEEVEEVEGAEGSEVIESTDLGESQAHEAQDVEQAESVGEAEGTGEDAARSPLR